MSLQCCIISDFVLAQAFCKGHMKTKLLYKTSLGGSAYEEERSKKKGVRMGEPDHSVGVYLERGQKREKFRVGKGSVNCLAQSQSLAHEIS